MGVIVPYLHVTQLERAKTIHREQGNASQHYSKFPAKHQVSDETFENDEAQSSKEKKKSIPEIHNPQ